MQDKALLGKRYTCFKCGAKFYDLNKPEPVCVKCGTDQREDPSPDPRVAVMARYKATKSIVPAKAAVNTSLDDDFDDGDADIDDDEDDDIVDGGGEAEEDDD
jgi:DNA-directed RNA polymerase subunit RPC12/RpoP